MDFSIIHNDRPSTMAELCMRHSVPYEKGSCYYLLQKKENVSSSKQLFAYHQTGEFNSNAQDIRSKFSITGTTLAPSDIPDGWELYIQSTSPNRKLPADTKALIRGTVVPIPPTNGQTSKAQPSAADVQLSKPKHVPVTAAPVKKDKHVALTEEPKKRKAEEASSSSTSEVSLAPGKLAKVSASQVGCWNDLQGSISFKDYGSSNSSTIVGVDMDWTVIRTKSGKTFALNANDWEFWSPQVPIRLQQAHQEGKKIVVFTNQNGIAKGKETLENVHQKLDAIQAALKVPMVAVIMYQNDMMRKPRTGAWEFVEQNLNGGVIVDRASSIYVGDGAGRVPPVVKKKDFGPGDLLFALNLKTQFNTPEQFFLGQKDGGFPTQFEFDPRKLGLNPVPLPHDVTAPAGPVEIVLCIGSPGSGKSNLSKRALPNHVHVNQDKLKTKEKCLKACAEAVMRGESVVVDNQNRSRSDREAYIKISKTHQVPIRAIRIDMPKDLCFHLNEYRALNKGSLENRGDQRVPGMVIHGFYKNVEEATLSEGFVTVSTLGIEHLDLQGTEGDISLIRSFLVS